MNNYFIVNPVAGKGKSIVSAIEKIKEECSNRDDTTIYLTKGIGDAERFCRETAALPGEHRFIVCGGDGTVCEALNGIIGNDNASLAIVPVGTGNDFVRNFYSRKEEKDLFFDPCAQLDGEEVLIDYLDVTIDNSSKKYSLNMLNSGFDSEVADRVNVLRGNKFIPAKFAYIYSLIEKFFQKPTVTATITVDGEEPDSKEKLLIAIGNGKFCGGGFKAAPKAMLCDGVMDLCAVTNIGRIKFLGLVGNYKKGTHLDNEKLKKLFTYRQCKQIEIAFDKPQKVVFDGETVVCEHLLIKNVNRKLRLNLPKGIDVSELDMHKECAAKAEAVTV